MRLDLNNAILVADVSGWQQADIGSLAGDGFKAVIIKVSEGLSRSNNVQRTQAVTAMNAGMALLGKYHFSLDRYNGADECDVALAQLADLPFQRVVMDAEASTMGPLPDPQQVIDFGRRAREWNPNVKPILYASESPMASLYGRYPEIAELFECWYAQYDSYTPKTWPSHAPRSSFPGWGTDIAGWQFTSTFPSSIGGIDASVFDPAILGWAPAPPPQPDWNAIRRFLDTLASEDAMKFLYCDDDGFFVKGGMLYLASDELGLVEFPGVAATDVLGASRVTNTGLDNFVAAFLKAKGLA